MAATQVSEAYVLGLLADLETQVPHTGRVLAQAQQRAAALEVQLGRLVGRLDAARAAWQEAEARYVEAADGITQRNQRMATLHQEIDTFRRKAEEMKIELANMPRDALYRQLRRERGAMLAAIEDRQGELERLKAEVQEGRRVVLAADRQRVNHKDVEAALVGELDSLQHQLPSPQLYLDLFAQAVARAHCRFFLDRDQDAWRRDMKRGVALMTELHGALRAGKYRLDKNSDVVGGRALATAEAILAATVMGMHDEARRLFELATDPSLFFHHIFNVFRVWLIGLYVSGRHDELRALLRTHQYSEGLRGAYALAFIGLVLDDERQVAVGLKDIVRHEWELFSSTRQVRGLGVVNLGALAVVRLALERGMRVQIPGPTVPDELMTAPRS